MGTRSLTRFIEVFEDRESKDITKKKVKKEIVVMYRQFDGYPEGHGTELANFLKDGQLVNGIGADPKKVFNGMGCLAAQVVGHFKDGKAGGFYLHAPKTKGCGEEYTYEIEGDFDTHKMTLRCFENGYMKGNRYMRGQRLLFEGDPKDFEVFVKKQAEEAK